MGGCQIHQVRKIRAVFEDVLTCKGQGILVVCACLVKQCGIEYWKRSGSESVGALKHVYVPFLCDTEALSKKKRGFVQNKSELF